MAIDYPAGNTRITATSTTSHTLNSTSSWTTHLTTGNFTTGANSSITAFVNLVHGYESGNVNVIGELDLNDGSTSTRQQLFCQGIGGNKAFGSHNMAWTWYNVGAGTYHVDLRIINKGSGTTGHTHYFHNGDNGVPDILIVTYNA